MEQLDLHRISHVEAEMLIEDFILRNIHQLPIKIITGNSSDMQKILLKLTTKFNLEISPENYNNLGAYLISNSI